MGSRHEAMHMGIYSICRKNLLTPNLMLICISSDLWSSVWCSLQDGFVKFSAEVDYCSHSFSVQWTFGLLRSLCSILWQRAAGLLARALWCSFRSYQCQHQGWFSLLRPLEHSLHYIGISLRENFSGPPNRHHKRSPGEVSFNNGCPKGHCQCGALFLPSSA